MLRIAVLLLRLSLWLAARGYHRAAQRVADGAVAPMSAGLGRLVRKIEAIDPKTVTAEQRAFILRWLETTAGRVV